jgi:hypothetical protein
VANITASPRMMPALVRGVKVLPAWSFIMGRSLMATWATAPAPAPRSALN